MLSHNIASKDANKDDGQTMGDGGGGRSGGRNTSTLSPPEQIAKCPRCDSSNTKFCYYNNYSLAQPRPFCKACKRYWTKGGALRNVPIGGSCKKNKKTKSCSSRFFPGEFCSKFSSYDIAGMKVLGPSTLDFQLSGLNILPRVTSPNQFTSSNQYSLLNLDPLGYNLPFSSSHINVMKQEHNQNGGEFGSFNEMGTTTSNHIYHIKTDLATSIESLSSINQDLHWKLQQQRLGMLFGGENDEQQQQKKKQVVLETHDHDQKLQPILFHNLETSKPVQSSMDGDHSRKQTGSGCGLATEWFFDNNGYAPVINPNRTNSSGAGNDQNGSMNNWNINGIQDWNDNLNQYSSVP
ncbi:hypothetical protein QVD17_37165 [Tagetes erecta]|uniref:Dof zinc finger protein n=1 Tax=Tagetes erecta TaxID=13708 RepID=A0AAD8NJT8_TARER|nr:hypothetical protein QVD17_37165 [Tagetes erecta]